jgi:hypothetical protein
MKQVFHVVYMNSSDLSIKILYVHINDHNAMK